jgi:hypothetical protein
MLNTRKNDNLIKYENGLLEPNRGRNTTFSDINYLSIDQNPQVSGEQEIENPEINNRIRSNMSSISKLLIENLKKSTKDINIKPSIPKTEVQDKKLPNQNEMLNQIQNVKNMLNKK